MTKITALRNILPLCLPLCLAISASHAATPEPAPFASEIAQFDAADAAHQPPPCATLFVGSSSIRLWPGLERDFAGMVTIQRGFGGSQTEHANRYFDRLVARYRPARIVFYEGENDLDAGKSVEQVEADFLEFLRLKTASLGTTPVYFVAVKPSPSRWDQFRSQSALNARIRALASQRDDLVFVDVVRDMLGPDDGPPDVSMYMDDELHMKASGYAIWRQKILDAFRDESAAAAPHCPAPARNAA